MVHPRSRRDGRCRPREPNPKSWAEPAIRGQVGSGSQDRCAARQGSNIALPKTPHRDSDRMRTLSSPLREITHPAPDASLEYPRRTHEMSGSSPGGARRPCGTLIDIEFNLATNDPPQPRVVLNRLGSWDDMVVSRRTRQPTRISPASAHPGRRPHHRLRRRSELARSPGIGESGPMNRNSP
jgi:hypothetical protein